MRKSKAIRATYFLTFGNSIAIGRGSGGFLVLLGDDCFDNEINTGYLVDLIKYNITDSLNNCKYLFDFESTYFIHKVYWVDCTGIKFSSFKRNFYFLDLDEGFPSNLMRSSKEIIKLAKNKDEVCEFLFFERNKKEREDVDLELETEETWLKVGDQRRWDMRLIALRDGQPKFRKMLMDEYQGECVITGCRIPQLLEAAHIDSYKGSHTNNINNGLLLRSDIHKLFDLHLISIDPESNLVSVHQSIVDDQYAKYRNVRIKEPKSIDAKPSKDALSMHARKCNLR